MISSRLVATTRTDVRTAIALLLLAEATLCFTFLFIVGPITTLERLLPLAVVLVLCAALYWGQHWAQWALLAPIAFRVWKPGAPDRCGLGRRTGGDRALPYSDSPR